MNEVGPNFIARPYRGVSVQDAPGLDEGALREWLIGRRVYRRTEFVVARRGGEHAVVQVEHPVGDDIVAAVTDLRVLARPDEVAFVADPAVDTGNASQMARVARAGARVTVVQGRFEHVNFIVEPAPLRVRVVEVVPPEPPKLLEMAQSVLDYDEDLPPVELDFAPIDLRDLAPAGPAMFPCRCSGLEGEFLDAGPDELGDWTLVGCERSRQIHVALYGAEPAARVDFCPRVLTAEDGPTLMKCCLFERGMRREGRVARRAVGRGARGGPRGAAGAVPMIFGHLWETAETRELFGDEGRTRIWLSVYGALAEAQGELGLIPRGRPRRRSPPARASRSTSRRWRRRRGAAATRRSG